MKKYALIIVALLIGIGLGAGCMVVAFLIAMPARTVTQTLPEEERVESGGANRTDTEDSDSDVQFAVTSGAAPGYIDDRACAECHQEIYESYQQVGMARSFARPSEAESLEDFQNNKFFHEASKRYYEMARRDGDLIFRRHQQDSAGTAINKFECKVDWILGSGKHARNYLYQTDEGELFQLPIAWYAQEGRWGMAAGFDNSRHEGVHKRVQRECMFCHNAYPDVPEGSDAYALPQTFPDRMPHGIGCQRCHGPGAAHAQIARTDLDAAAKFRNTIVNTSRLDAHLRDDACNQCHLQPSSTLMGVRRFGKSDYAYRPGQSLDDYLVALDVVEKEKPASERFEINHHGYRLQQSACFIKSDGDLSCVTCHDPHRQVAPEERARHYRDACAKCHQQEDCTVDAEGNEQLAKVGADDCVACHMPKRRTQDVVHVFMTDHLIARSPKMDEDDAEPQESKIVLQDVVRRGESDGADRELEEIYRAVAKLRLSEFTHPQAGDDLENLLAVREVRHVEPFLDLTVAHLKQRRFAAAARTAADILTQFPRQPNAGQWQGTALLTLGQYDRAEEALQRALKDSPLPAEIHYNLGLLRLAADDPAQAEDHFKRAIQLSPNMYMASLYLGQTYEKQDRLGEAERAYRRTLELEPAFTRAYLSLGKALLALDRSDEAGRLWQFGISVVPDPAPLANAYQEAEFSTMQPILSESVVGPQVAPLNAMFLAVPSPELERLEKAVADQIRELLGDFDRIRSQRTVSADMLAQTYGTLGQLYHAYEFYDAAERAYLNSIRVGPADPVAHHLLGALYQQVGELGAAEQYFKQSLQLDPNYIAGVLRLGDVYLQQNELKKAREQFEQALTLMPDSAAAHNGLGEVALSEKNYKEAIDAFQKALQEVPDANRIHYSLAMAYRGLGELDKAQEHLDQRGKVGIRPADPLVDALPSLLQGERVYLIRGQLAFGAGRYTEAGIAFSKAVEANPSSVTALVNFGTTLVKLGNPEKAAEQYQKALEHEPDAIAAHFNLGILMGDRGMHAAAIEHFQKVLDLEPGDNNARRKLADALRNNGQLDEAIEQLETLAANDPGDSSAVELADLLVSQKQYERALKVLDGAMQKAPDQVSLADALARLLATCPDLDLRNGARAVELAAAVLEAEPTLAHTETMALAFAEAGRCSEAAALQKRLVEEAEKIEDTQLAERLRKELVRYEKGEPCRPESAGVPE